MLKKNQSILKIMNLRTLTPRSFHRSIQEATIQTFKVGADVPTVLCVGGRKKDDDNLYVYNFNLSGHEDIHKYKTFEGLVQYILKDLRSSSEFEKIEIVVFQTRVKMLMADLDMIHKIDDITAPELSDKIEEGIVIMWEFEDEKKKEVLFKRKTEVFKASEINAELVRMDGTDPQFGIYINGNSKTNEHMSEKIKVKQKTIWDSLGIEENYFDFIDDIINDAKSNKANLSDTMKKIIIGIREKEYGVFNPSEHKITEYELKVFLAGKQFESKLNKLKK